jgi:hypothetical protein
LVINWIDTPVEPYRRYSQRSSLDSVADQKTGKPWRRMFLSKAHLSANRIIKSPIVTPV